MQDFRLALHSLRATPIVTVAAILYWLSASARTHARAGSGRTLLSKRCKDLEWTATTEDEAAATKIYFWRSMRTPVGSGAGHDPPVTPLLVSVSAVELALPVMVAVPVHAVPSVTVPLNDSWPLIDEPLNVAVTFPDHATASPVHVALMVDPLCVTLTVICSDALFVEANVPRHVPEISIAVPKLDDVGPLGEPEHASVTISAKRISAWRIAVAT